MARRKTVDVDRVREIANKMLADSADKCIDGRKAVATLLESILMDTGNYHGFRYIDGTPVGAVDDTRRRYH
jgi:hypothetical protein